MSPEQQHPIPTGPETVTADMHATFEGLKHDPDVMATFLDDDAIYHLNTTNMDPGSTHVSTEEGITQEPLALIRTGSVDGEGDVYSVIRATRMSDGMKRVIVAHMDSDRAKPLGVIDPDNAMSIGRHHNNARSDTTSRRHFGIGMTPDGKLGIRNASANGTEILTKPNERIVTTGQLAPSGIAKAIRGTDPNATKNPLSSRSWTVPSADLKRLF